MLPLTLEVYDKNGVQYEPAFRGLRFAKSFFGGEDLWLVFVLDRDTSIDYPDIAYGNDVVLRTGLKSIWRGEIREIESDLETVTVKCRGMSVYLDDYSYGGMGKLWCDSKVGMWREGPVELFNLAPALYQMDTLNRIFIAPRKGEQFSPSFCGAMYYQCNYDKVKRIAFDYDVVLAANWMISLYIYDEEWQNPAIPWGLTGVTQSGVKDIDIGSDPVYGERPLIAFVMYYNGPLTTFAGGTGSCYAKFTGVRLFGENGPLSLAIENPSVIHVAEDIIKQLTT